MESIIFVKIGGWFPELDSRSVKGIKPFEQRGQLRACDLDLI